MNISGSYRSIRVGLVGLAGTCMVMFGLPVQASTVQFSASVWGSARDAGRDGSFETISFPTAIVVQRLPALNLVDRGIWEFNLAALPADPIDKITMQLLVVSTSLERASVDVYGFAGNGVIETSDATGGSLIAANLGGDLAGISIDVTSFILDPVVQAAGFAGFYVRYSVEAGGSINQQKQLQDPGIFGNQSPRLVVEVSPIPVPAAAWFLGSSLTLLAFMRRGRCLPDGFR